MQIVIPMSGRGQRFRDAGYASIKPLIEVDGMPMIEHVVRMFPGENDFVFICARDHLESTPLRAVLNRLVPEAPIVAIEPHKKGPVHAVLQAAPWIKDDDSVVVNYCDFSVGWDYDRFKWEMATRNPAGCLTAYRGFHPHSLGPNLYAYLRHRDNYLLEIREKGCFTEDRMNEYASSGTYYFRSGALLKEYFAKAVASDLKTNGEYYASMPYNLLVGDGLPVYIHELEHFLQWGTPEDLAEYVGWSEYFAKSAEWAPRQPAKSGTNLLPMVGAGVRFQREGYARPKPVIPVAGVPMVERSLNSLPPAENWIAVCRSEHLQDPDVRPALRGADRDIETITVDELTAGQASTCLLAADRLDPEAPLLIGPCDTAVVYDEERYAALLADPRVDCIVWTFRNHPHANRNPRQYGWVETTADGNVLGIRCKEPLGPDVSRDPGVIGAFWFRKARYFVEAARELIRQDRRVNNEFYVDTAIGVLLEQGRSAKVFDVKHYLCFGTPNDVRTFEYWESYFRKAAHHPYGKEAFQTPPQSRRSQAVAHRSWRGGARTVAHMAEEVGR